MYLLTFFCILNAFAVYMGVFLGGFFLLMPGYKFPYTRFTVLVPSLYHTRTGIPVVHVYRIPVLNIPVPVRALILVPYKYNVLVMRTLPELFYSGTCEGFLTCMHDSQDLYEKCVKYKYSDYAVYLY